MLYLRMQSKHMLARLFYVLYFSLLLQSEIFDTESTHIKVAMFTIRLHNLGISL